MLNSDLLTRAKQVVSPVLGHYSDLQVEKAAGCYLYDFSGKAYLDFACGIAVTSTGHCHPQVVQAIQEQAAKLIHTCIGVAYYEPYVALAEKLVAILGEPFGQVFLCQSGSEAIEASIKLAKYTTKKPGILAFSGGFHGRTLGALSITTSKKKYWDGYGKLLPDVVFTPYPYCYRCPYGKEKATCDMFCLAKFEVDLPDDGANIAAVVIEPVLGEGGYVPPPAGFLAGLKAICAKKGMLLIFDEIQTGVGRTGEWFYFQKVNVVPDIIALAKGLASGMPLGACVASKELMSKWTTGAHGGTFGGNPVSCAAGVATLDVLAKKVPEINALSKVGYAYLQQELAACPIVGDIRCEGLMIGVEFVKDKTTKEPYPEIIAKLIKGCLENGLVIISCGLYDNVIRLIPPLVITKEELLKGLEVFRNVIIKLN